MTIIIDTGNHIAAKAAVMAKPDVVAAYPITPQTTLVEGIANYKGSGEFKGYICAGCLTSGSAMRSLDCDTKSRSNLLRLITIRT